MTDPCTVPSSLSSTAEMPLSLGIAVPPLMLDLIVPSAIVAISAFATAPNVGGPPAFPCSTVVVVPIMDTILFYVLGRFAAGESAAGSFAIGMTAATSSRVVIAGIAQSFANERSYGTLPFLFFFFLSANWKVQAWSNASLAWR